MNKGRYTVDATGAIQEWDQGMERLTGYLRHEVAGRSCEELQCDECIHANCPFEFPGLSAFATPTEKPLPGCMRRSDGEIVPVVKELHALSDATGAAIAGEIRIQSAEPPTGEGEPSTA